MNTIYARVKTNRHTLKKYIDEFKRVKIDGESLIAPRSQVGQFQNSYYALVVLLEGSSNHLKSKKFSGYVELEKDDFENLVNGVKFSWKA